MFGKNQKFEDYEIEEDNNIFWVTLHLKSGAVVKFTIRSEGKPANYFSNLYNSNVDKIVTINTVNSGNISVKTLDVSLVIVNNKF